MRQNTVLFLGNYDGSDPVLAATRQAVLDAAAHHHVVTNTRWMNSENLALYPGMVAESSAVVLPPQKKASPDDPFDPALLQALTAIRTGSIPFLATGSAHGMVFVELVREVIGRVPPVDSLRRSQRRDSVVQPVPAATEWSGRHEIELELVDDPFVAEVFGAHRHRREWTDVRQGLNPDYAAELTRAGLRPIALDRHGGRPYLHVLSSHPFHVTAAFLPQLNSTRSAPHPLFLALIASTLKP